MKLTTAGQAGNRNNGPACRTFETLAEKVSYISLNGGTGDYRVAARRVDSRSRRGFSIAAPHSWYLPIDASAR